MPEGRYRITKTINVWPGVRVIGYGKTRPVFFLGEKTPGYQEGEGKYMVWLCGGRGRDGTGIRDGTPGTFYSAFSNIDIEIGDGNPAAIGMRFHVAQHCYVSHIDFRIGQGKAGMQQAATRRTTCTSSAASTASSPPPRRRVGRSCWSIPPSRASARPASTPSRTA